MAKSQSSDPDAGPDMDSYQASSDADVLKKHNEITSDPKRHQAAHAKLAEQTQQHSSALDASHKKMRQKVKKGLKQAFPSGIDQPTPFQKSGEKGSTPFTEAEQKD